MVAIVHEANISDLEYEMIFPTRPDIEELPPLFSYDETLAIEARDRANRRSDVIKRWIRLGAYTSASSLALGLSYLDPKNTSSYLIGAAALIVFTKTISR